jgi:regulator of replication initiation timing
MEKIRQMQQDQQANTQQHIAQNKQEIEELQKLIRKLGDENSMLRLELEERKAKLDYSNTVAAIEQEKRSKADSIIFSSPIYIRLQEMVGSGQSMSGEDLSQLDKLVNSVYTDFTGKLFSLYKMTSQEYAVSLLVKVRFAPKDIATLTAHSKESVASTRSRLYAKIFGQKGSTKDWDDFVLSL